MNRLAALAFLLASLLPTSALAQVTLSPDCCGFTVQYPEEARVISAPQSTVDGATKFPPTSSQMFVQPHPGNFMPLVAVDLYDNGSAMTPDDLVAERDDFVRGFRGTMTATHTGTVGGAPALIFEFDAEGGAHGRAMLVLRKTPKARVYLMAVVWRGGASSQDIANANAIFDSFKLV